MLFRGPDFEIFFRKVLKIGVSVVAYVIHSEYYKTFLQTGFTFV